MNISAFTKLDSGRLFTASGDFHEFNLRFVQTVVVVALCSVFLLRNGSNIFFWPRLWYKAGDKKDSRLVPLNWQHVRGIHDILSYLQTSFLFHADRPVRLSWLGFNGYIVQGVANIRSTFQNKSLSTFFFQGIFVNRVFLLPDKDLGLFWTEEGVEDNGHQEQLSKYGENEVRNDFGSRSAQHISNLLSGPGTGPFNRRFDVTLGNNLKNLVSSDDAKDFADFKEALDTEIVRSFIDTLCGSFLLKTNPHFLEDWQYVHDNITLLFMRFPRFTMPRIYQARDRCLRAVQEWTEWAATNFSPESISEDGFDPFWGHSFFRERTAMYLNVDRFPFSSIAAHNLGLLWGGTANSSPAAFWAIYEISKDPELLEMAREEAAECRLATCSQEILEFDFERLLKKPVLQAIVSETLRLRVHGIIPRKCPQSGVNVRGSVIPGHDLFFINSTTEHLDPKIWCTGSAADHPPEEFWPGRFLLPNKTAEGKYVYSINGKSGAWLPFGGGAHMCPGRFLAKRIMIGCIAHIVTRYDCDIISDREVQGMKGMSLRTFGLGTLHPAGPVPVRLRPRIQKIYN